jgi:hypothetical protein
LDILRSGVGGRWGVGEKNVEDGTSVPMRMYAVAEMEWGHEMTGP